MKPAINDASARHRAGRPPPVPRRRDGWENRPRSPDIIAVERQIAEFVDRSTEDLRVAWRELHRTGPPQGSERLLIGCKSKPMAARAGRSGAACRHWPESSRRAAGPPI